MTETLTETALAAIEARVAVEYEHDIAPHNRMLADIPALCRSLRAAWATIPDLTSRTAYDWANIVEAAQSETDSLRAQLAQVEKERDTVWQRAIQLVHGEAESAVNRARRIRDRYGDEGADEESAETLACETARNIKRALERAARMDSEGITEEDIAETLNPTRYPENL